MIVPSASRKAIAALYFVTSTVFTLQKAFPAVAGVSELYAVVKVANSYRYSKYINALHILVGTPRSGPYPV